LTVVAFGASALHAAAISDQQTTSRTSGTEALSTQVKVGWLGDITNWNPMNIVTEEDYVACYLMFSALFTYDQDWNGPVGDLALSWYQRIQPDDTMITTINITENAHFRNKANPTDDTLHLTANDVKYTFDRIMANPGGTWDIYLLDITSVTVQNDQTIVITTAYPKATLIDDLSGIPIIPQYIWNSVSDRQFLAAKTPSWLVGSGPFYFDASATGAWYRFTRAPNYFGAVEYLGVRAVKAVDSILYTVYADPSALTIAMNSGMEDCAVLTGSPNLYVNTLGVNSNVNVIKQAVNEPGFCDIAINAIPMLNRTSTYGKGNPLLLDPVVRQAIEMTLNRDEIVGTIMSGLPAMADSVIQPGFWHKTISSQLPFDPVAARALLMANGDYIDTDGDGYLEATATSYPVQQGWTTVGSELSFRLHASEIDASYFVIAQNWVPWAAQAGIRFTASQLSEAWMTNSDWYKANYDVWVWHWGEGPEPLSTLGIWLWDEMRPGGDNCQMPMGPTPGAYDAKYRQAQRTLDKTERKAMVDQLQQWVYDSYCEMPPYYYIGLYGFTDERWTGWGDWSTHPGRTVISQLLWLWFDLVPYNANKKPVFDTTLDSAYQILVNTAYAFSVTVHDDDADPLTVNWSFGDGTFAQDPIPGVSSTTPTTVTRSHTYTTVDLTGLTMTVKLWDYQAGHEATSTAIVYVVTTPDTAPTFTSPVSANPPSPSYVGTPVTWSVSAMDAESGGAAGFGLRFTWVWGDGSYTVTNYKPTTNNTPVTDTHAHTWTVDATYSVRVWVWDGIATNYAVHNVSSTPIYYSVSPTLPGDRTVDYRWYDMFDVPFGEWWDVRGPIYNDYWPITDSYPYLYEKNVRNGYYVGDQDSKVMSMMRLNVTANNLPNLNMLGNPEFLPMLGTERGGVTKIDWYMQYMTSQELAPYPQIALDNDGYITEITGDVTMDAQAAKTILGIDDAGLANFATWWSTHSNSVSDAFDNWTQQEANLRLCIYDMYESMYYPLFLQLNAEKVGTNVVLHISQITWGMECLMAKWLHELFMPTEWYFEDMNLHATISPGSGNLSIDTAVEECLSARTSMTDDQPCWAWQGLLGDYVLYHTNSEFQPYVNKAYVDRYVGSTRYGRVIPFERTPGASNLQSGESLLFEWPAGTQLFLSHLGPGMTGDVYSEIGSLLSEPGQWDFPAQVVLDQSAREIRFTGPIDMYDWSESQTSHQYLATEWDRLGVLPYGLPFLEFRMAPPPPQPPVPSFSFTPQLPDVWQIVSFDGAASYDPDGQIVDWSWDFGDGTYGSGMSINHIFQTIGYHTVTLELLDDSGLSAAMTLSVRVSSGVVAPDQYEPDDDYNAAKEISPGVTQYHSIDMAGLDVDWVTFDIVRTCNVTIETNSSYGPVTATIFDESGQVAVPQSVYVIYDPDWTSTKVQATYLTPGIYFAEAQEGGNDQEIQSYDLNLIVEIGAASWTFLVYLDADNNLEDVGSIDFNEMASVGSNSDLNIVVQMDRTPYYDVGYGDWMDTKRFFVTPGMQPIPENAVEDLGEMNMGDLATLQDFVTWGINNYPADNYALVLWDHGGGWDGAVCWDDTDYGDSLTLDEVKTAIANAESATGAKIDLLGYDACLMGMAEVVYETKDLVDVVVASEETIPWDGWPYNTVLSDLASDPMMTAQEFGSSIVSRYMEYYTYGGWETNSAINVASTSWLYSSIDAFANALIASMPDYRSQIMEARTYTQTFTYSTYADLHSFADQLTLRLPGGALFDAAVDIENALQSCMIAEGHGSYLPNAHGLSIYFPSDINQYWSAYETALDFTADHSWDEFLREFLKIGPDVYEPDNSWTEATWINSGEVQTHSISDGGSDVDWVTFEVYETTDIRLRTFSYSGFPGDTEMWLFDAAGVPTTPIAYNNDAGGTTWSTIRATVEPGQYYVMVGSFGGSMEIASYELSLETGYIPNEPPYAAFMFWPVPLVGIPTTFDGSYSYDPDGVVVDYFWDFGDGSVGNDAIVVHTFLAAGSYLVTLTVTDDCGASSMSGGMFDVQEPVAPDMYEDDDTYLDASTISLGETQQHSISDAGMDIDWVTFSLAEPTFVEIYTSGPQDQYSDTIIVLFDEAGVPNSPIAWNDDGGQWLWSRIVISLDAGTYYVLVTSYTMENEIREYYITLEVSVPVAPDSYEPDNDWTIASQIALGETQTHSISDLGYDVDWVTFALAEQTTVSIMTSGEPMTDTDTIIALYDGYGVPYQPLAMSDDFWENGTSLIQVTLGAGQYWVEIWSYDSESEISTYYLHLIEGIVHNEPPIASFGYWPSPAVGVSVTFDGQYSWDPDGWIESYAWDFGDGTSSEGSYVSHTFWEAGDYLVTLTVTDNLGAPSFMSTWIYVYENLPPVAYLSCSTTHASPGEPIYMSAYGSYDPDGGIWYMNWDFGDGNVWTGIYMWDVWYAYYQPGAYTVTVTVFDYYGASSSASVTIFINMPPVPVISSPALGKVGFPVTFDGSSSFDPDGFITSYFWDFGDGFTATDAVVTHVYSSPGTYWVYLIVSDDMWAYGSTVMQFMVVQPVPPVAIAVYDVPRPLVGQIVLFDGSNSVDPDGFIVSYMWQFGDGSYAQGVAATHVYAHAGIYDVRLTVIDEDGLADDNVVSITVASVPIAGFTYSPLGARAGQTISFYASDSYDETGIVEYEWDFGDGSYATGWQVTHAYSAGGRYDVTLSVTNVYGITASTDQGVPVKVFMAYVKGTVVTPDLKPLKGATVQISQAGIIIGQAKTNGEDGHWTLVLKHPGTYDLTISKRGYQTLKMSITVSGGTLDLGKITLAANVGVISLSNVNPTPTGFPVMGMLVGMAVFGVASVAKRWRKSSAEEEEYPPR
jgi:ABC-type transport system substrate-binding protein/PKD repeat protein